MGHISDGQRFNQKVINKQQLCMNLMVVYIEDTYETPEQKVGR